MSKIYYRGQKIVFRHVWRTTLDVVSTGLTTAAKLLISYPTSGWPFRNDSTNTTVTMVESTQGSTHADYASWSCTWASANAYPGPVHYQIRPSNLTLPIEEGMLTLRGNPANLIITTTTE